MNEETVTCQICGHVTTQINYAHLKKHNMTSAQYKEMFPNSKMRVMSQKLKEKKRKQFAEMNQSIEFREENSKKLTGKPKSEEHKLALKKAKENEDKKKRAKINGNNRRGKPQPKGWVQNMRINYGGVFRGRSGFREDLGHYVRSRWEANYARVLKLKKIKYKFERDTFFLTRLDGSVTSYTPDFYLFDSDLYIEVKGFWMDDAENKFKFFKEQYPHIKIDVVDATLYNALTKQFKDQIPEWE